MKQIKVVPSKIFNSGLDKWIARSLGKTDTTECMYCKVYGWKGTLTQYEFECKCPLYKKNQKIILSKGKAHLKCCNGLFNKWCYFKYKNRNKQAMKIADQIVDMIIDRCVYEVIK